MTKKKIMIMMITTMTVEVLMLLLLLLLLLLMKKENGWIDGQMNRRTHLLVFKRLPAQGYHGFVTERIQLSKGKY